MGLNETTKHMREQLAALAVDLEKAVGGNKAASQRVRTGTIRLEKIAKNYRKESINAEKQGGSKKSAKKAKAPAKSAAKAPAKSAAKAKAKAPAKAAVKAKAPAKKPVMVKRPTAKLPVRK
jgi:hypothetical protein